MKAVVAGTALLAVAILLLRHIRPPGAAYAPINQRKIHLVDDAASAELDDLSARLAAAGYQTAAAPPLLASESVRDMAPPPSSNALTGPPTDHASGAIDFGAPPAPVPRSTPSAATSRYVDTFNPAPLTNGSVQPVQPTAAAAVPPASRVLTASELAPPAPHRADTFAAMATSAPHTPLTPVVPEPAPPPAEPVVPAADRPPLPTPVKEAAPAGTTLPPAPEGRPSPFDAPAAPAAGGGLFGGLSKGASSLFGSVAKAFEKKNTQLEDHEEFVYNAKYEAWMPKSVLVFQDAP